MRMLTDDEIEESFGGDGVYTPKLQDRRRAAVAVPLA